MGNLRPRLRHILVVAPVLIVGGLLGATILSTGPLDLTCCVEGGVTQASGTERQHAEGAADHLPSAAPVEYATTRTFDQQVLSSPVPVLVDFYADWCVPCQVQDGILVDFASTSKGVKLVKVNVDENRELARRFRVEGLPTVLIFKDGRLVSQHMGVTTKEELERALAG